MADRFHDILTVGFDKNGEADFRVRGSICDLDLERMNRLRAMVAVGIGTMEDMWRRERQHSSQDVARLTPRPTEDRS